jgi:hypothetical protein
MVEEIIAEMPSLFRKGVFSKREIFSFTLDEITITVIIDAQSYTLVRGTVTEKVDCSCKTSAEMFRKIWYDGYKPGIMDFLGGEIKTDAPLMLPHFLEAFGK